MSTRAAWHGMGRSVPAVLLTLLFAGACYAQGDAEFQRWLERQRAIQQSAGATLAVGDFQVVLPLGWVREAGPEGASAAEAGTILSYVGPQGNGTPRARVTLHAEAADSEEGMLSRTAGWPSAFSGWTTIKPGGLWGLRSAVPAEGLQRVRHVVQFPATTSTLVAEVEVPGGEESAWPACVDDLLRAVSYAGGGTPLIPPGQPGATASYRSERVARAAGQPLNAASPLQPAALESARAIQAGGDPSAGNRVLILDQGYDALLLRLHLIRNAARSIKIQTYIWSNDETGRLFMYELVQAARRGVKVQVIADHISSVRDVDLVAFLATASPNLEIRHYRPAADRLDPNMVLEALDFVVPNNTNQRMHNKLLLIDDAVFITGGRNIENTYYNQAPRLNYRDRDVMVIGPMAAYAAGSFDEYWGFKEAVPSRKLKDVGEAIRKGKFKRLETLDDYHLHGYFDRLENDVADAETIRARFAAPLREAAHVMFAADPPGKGMRYYTAWRRGTMARQIEAAMQTAEQGILLQTPYLILDGGMLRLFRDLRKSRPGLRVVVSSNSYGSTDSPITYAANFKLRKAYLEEAGLSVYEFMPQPAALDALMPNYPDLLSRTVEPETRGAKRDKPHLCVHAKSFVVDERLAFIGSYNFDPRSIALNTEIGVFIEDAAVAAQLAGLIGRDIGPQNSWVIARLQEPRDEARLARLVEAPAAQRGLMDLWSARFTSSFELKQGMDAVWPGHPRFLDNYRDRGAFPGADENLTFREILTLLMTTLSDMAIPLL